MAMNLKGMKDVELSQLAEEIKEELEARRRLKKELLWQDLRSAIFNYLTAFGEISIYDAEERRYLTTSCDFSAIGEITLY